MSDLSYIGRPNGNPIPYITIPEILKRRAKCMSDSEAFIIYTDGRRDVITFGELFSKSEDFARAMISLGLRKGDKVLTTSNTNTIPWLISVFGFIRVGAIPVASFNATDDGSDSEYIVGKVHPVIVCISGTQPEQTLATMQMLQRVQHPSIKHVISLDSSISAEGCLSFDELMVQAETLPTIPKIYIDNDDTVFIFRTSGSTGRPKLVEHTHRSLSGKGMEEDLNNTKVKMKTFIGFVFTTNVGSPFKEILFGQSRVTLSNNSPPPPLADILKYIEVENCVGVSFPPDVLNSLIFQNLSLPRCVQFVVHTGCSLKNHLKQILETRVTIISLYGLVETGRIAEERITPGSEFEINAGGYPSPGVEVKVVNEMNEVVKRGRTGKILTRKAIRFDGYYGDEVLTNQTITKANWVHTGDVGYISDNGKLYIVGRSDDAMRFAHGSSRQPSEIENVIWSLKISDIQDVVALPLVDKINTNNLCLCIIRKEGSTVSEQQLLNTIRERIISPMFNPDYVVYVDSFPVNINGKVDRKRLIKQVDNILKQASV